MLSSRSRPISLSDDRAGAGRLDPDILDGVVKGAEGADTIKIVDPTPVLQRAFERIGARAGPARRQPPPMSRSLRLPTEARPKRDEPRSSASTSARRSMHFRSIACARSCSCPGAVAEIAGSETAVLGVVTLRGRLLPLVSLRALLGMPQQDERGANRKVIVVSIGNASVGVVADRTREILRIDPGLIDPAPALLTRGAGDAEIEFDLPARRRHAPGRDAVSRPAVPLGPRPQGPGRSRQ